MLRIETPRDLLEADAHVVHVVPFTYAVGASRNRSFESRQLTVRYKPWPAGRSADDFTSPRPNSDSYLELVWPTVQGPEVPLAYDLIFLLISVTAFVDLGLIVKGDSQESNGAQATICCLRYTSIAACLAYHPVMNEAER